MNRNYYVSIGIHILFLLLILLFPLMHSAEKKAVEAEHVIVVDFSRLENKKASPAKSSASKKSSPPVKVTAKEQKKAQATPAKKKDPTPVKNSVKKTSEDAGDAVESTKPVKQEKPKGPSKEEIEAQERKKEKEAKKSKFSVLLSKSKKVEDAESESGNGIEEGSNDKKGTSASPGNGNIRGALGNRKVIKVPTIKDESQKKGRVVVKICVDAGGDVISSQYTMMGSTTSDTYLIKLAEKGAKGYKFSPSPNPKECGKVVIDFLLK